MGIILLIKLRNLSITTLPFSKILKKKKIELIVKTFIVIASNEDWGL